MSSIVAVRLACSVEGCDRRTRTPSADLCGMHYQRKWKHGDPTVTLRAPDGAYPALVSALVNEEADGVCRPTPYGTDANGYAVTSLNGRLIKVTHLVLAASGRPRPAGLIALHSCDNPPCLAPWHLRWGTCAENTQEAYDRGLKTPPTNQLRDPRGRFI